MEQWSWMGKPTTYENIHMKKLHLVTTGYST